MEQRIKTERETKINAVIKMFKKEIQNRDRSINALEKQNAALQTEMREKEKKMELLKTEMRNEIRKREESISSLKTEMRNEMRKKEKKMELLQRK